MKWTHVLGMVALITGITAFVAPIHAGGTASTRWWVQTSGTTVPLLDVACFNGLRCKAVGVGGTLRYTRDGGRTWREQRNPLTGTTTPITRIACVAPASCYATAPPTTVLITHNGGVSWTSVSLPVAATISIDASCMTATSYANRGRAGICRNGVTDVACTGVNTCYVTTTPSALFRTVDGGITWTAQTIPSSAPCEGDCSTFTVPYPLEWVSCPTADACYAGGSRYVGSHEGFAAAVITMTGSGNPWSLVHGDSQGFAPDYVACPHPGHCFGIFISSPFDPGTRVWRTGNGGLEWTQLAGGSLRIRKSISCVDNTHCVTAGNQGSITAAYNGTTFSAMKSPTSRNLYAVRCITAAICYAVGNHSTIVARK